MLSVPKIKAAGYAMKMRMKGYHLLKNPTGTPQTEVNMLKTDIHVTRHWDDMFEYEKVSKTFTDNGSKKVTKSLLSTHFFDVDKKEMMSPKKKSINLIIEGDNAKTVYAEREDIPLEIADNRKEPKFSLKRSNLFLDDSEYDKIRHKKERAAMDRRYYKTKHTLIQKIATPVIYKKVCYPQENRPNFFKVLYQNLTNK